MAAVQTGCLNGLQLSLKARRLPALWSEGLRQLSELLAFTIAHASRETAARTAAMTRKCAPHNGIGRIKKDDVGVNAVIEDRNFGRTDSGQFRDSGVRRPNGSGQFLGRPYDLAACG
jgi:hypothetical protein